VTASWRTFYAEVEAALTRCGAVPDPRILEALAPSHARHPPRHWDLPVTRARRLWTLHEQLASGDIVVPDAHRTCMKTAIALWEIRLEDLAQSVANVTSVAAMATLGIIAAKVAFPQAAGVTALALVPGLVTLVTARDNVHRQNTKRAVVRIKVML
jgi:hypothetical protein